MCVCAAVFYEDYPVQGFCVRSADCKSTGFLWLYPLPIAGWSLTTRWRTSDPCWKQQQWETKPHYLMWLTRTSHQLCLTEPMALFLNSFNMSFMLAVPHGAVYLGCFTDTGIPEVNGTGFCSYHCQNVPIFIPVHSHTTPWWNTMVRKWKTTFTYEEKHIKFSFFFLVIRKTELKF